MNQQNNPTPSVPDSAAELATAIVLKSLTWKDGGLTTDWLEPLIVAFGRAQYEKGRKEVLDEQKCKDCGCSYERCCCNPMRETEAYERGLMQAAANLREQFNAGVEVGRKDAIEKAAEVAKAETCGAMFPNCDQCDCGEEIAVKLRALLPKEGAKG